MEEFQVITQETGDWTLLVLDGDIDLGTAPELRQAILECVASGRNNLGIVLEKVEFMDSTGLAALVGGVKRTKENDGELVLIRPNDQIRRVLDLTDLDKIFPVYDSVSQLTRADLQPGPQEVEVAR